MIAVNNQTGYVMHLRKKSTIVSTHFPIGEVLFIELHSSIYWIKLFNFLLQGIEFWCRKEFAESNAKAITNHLDGDELGVLTLSVKNVLDAGGRKCRNRSQFVDADFMLSA